jgi:hypothetical protein
VLQVGIDNGHVGCGAGEDAFYRCAGQATSPDTVQTPDPGQPLRQLSHSRCSAVGRVVIDEDHLPGKPVEMDSESAYEQLQIVTLVVGRRDNRQFDRRHRIVDCTSAHERTAFGEVSPGTFRALYEPEPTGGSAT